MGERRLKEQEDEEMKLAMALSASLAQVEVSKKTKQQKQQQQQVYAPSAPPNIVPLPNAPIGWSVFRTADGEIFYQNDATGITQWEAPIEEQKQSAMAYPNQQTQYANNQMTQQNVQPQSQRYGGMQSQVRQEP